MRKRHGTNSYEQLDERTGLALIHAVRSLATGKGVEGTLRPLTGGLRHQVVESPALAPEMVAKVFSGEEMALARAEWTALTHLKDSHFTPRPVLFDPDPVRPVIVMSKVPGEPRTLQDLDEPAYLTIARMHSWCHAQTSVTTNLASNHPGRLLRDARRLLNDPATMEPTEPNQVQVISAAQQWIMSVELEEFVDSGGFVFCRGDTNVTNYLWQATSLSLVDFEESGLNDPIFEVADFVEHPLRRALPAWAVNLVASTACPDRPTLKRLETGRRLAACYWLAVLLRLRNTDAEARLGVSTADQASRVAERLSL